MSSRCSARILAGRYRLDARIGSGGAADVHRGFDLRMRRPVAIKVFRPGTGFDTEEDFLSEAMILARLQHPGLVTAYDAGRHDGDAYLVMQLIEGPTLKARIAEGPLSWRATAVLGRDLAEALAHAHETGVVHRDVKPSNILLEECGRSHLTDFGISRLLGATTRTATGTLTGTAAYLSPEQVLGRPVGPPADVYALGLVLLECLTGRLEYEGGPLEAAIARLHRRPELPPSLPEDLAALLRDMTALDEQTRPTARRCAQALASLVADTTDPTSARVSSGATNIGLIPASSQDTHRTHRKPPAAVRPASPPALRRHRTLLAGATATLAAVTAAAFGVTLGPSDQGSESKSAHSADTSAAKSASPAPSASDATAVPQPSGTHPGAGNPLKDAARGPGTRPAAGSPSRNPVTELAQRSRTDTSGNSAQGASAATAQSRAKTFSEPPGQAGKGGTGWNSAQGHEAETRDTR